MIETPGEQASDLAAGSTLGRYVIVGQLGRGGMGVVYEALDPELDRKVAIKLFSVGSSGRRESDQRALAQSLVAEAKAIAKINHQNVVSVYDVGMDHNEVFVAMELIRGRTLNEWCKLHCRTWQDTLKVYLQLAPGLSAVHEAGLVHRDFKPENVLVSEDGIPKLLDFGIAFDQQVSQQVTFGAANGDVGNATVVDIAGTPAYMSPEQHLGRDVGPQSDQFSFCVALYEAITGVRPFSGSSRMALTFAVQNSEIQSPRISTRVPKRILKALRKGLAAQPRDRYASIEQLCSVLRQNPSRRRLSWFMGISIGASSLLVLQDAQSQNLAIETQCREAASRLDESWAGEKQVFDRTSAPPALWGQARYKLRKLSEQWRQSYFDVCVAKSKGLQSSATVPIVDQLRCLENQKEDLDALIRVSDDPDRNDPHKLMLLISNTPEPASCADQSAIELEISRPTDPVRAQEVSLIRTEVRRLQQRIELGQFQGLLPEALAVRQRGSATGFLPVIAETNLLAIEAHQHSGRSNTLLAWGRQSLEIGEAISSDEIVVDALRLMIFESGYRLGDYESSRNMLNHALAHARRIDDGGKSLALLYAVGVPIYIAHGKMRRASELAGLSMRNEALSSDERVGSLNNWGVALYYLGEFTEAAERIERAVRIHRATAPASTLESIYTLGNLSLIHASIGNFDRAVEYGSQADALATEMELPANEAIIRSRRQLAEIAAFRGNYDLARKLIRSAMQSHAIYLGSSTHELLFVDHAEWAWIENVAGLQQEAIDRAQSAWDRAQGLHAEIGRAHV